MVTYIFLLHSIISKFSVRIILLNLKKKLMQIMTAKTTTLGTLYVHVVLNSVIFPQVLYDIALYAQVFPKYCSYKLGLQLPQKATWNNGLRA